MFLLFRKRAASHETRLDNIKSKAAVLHSDVTSSKDSTLTAIRVLTDEVSRHDVVLANLQQIGVK